MDTRRLALYLAGKLPPHPSIEFDRMRLFKLARGKIGEIESADFLKVIDSERFYSMILSEIDRTISEEEFLRLLDEIEVPPDAITPISTSFVNKRKVVVITEGKTDALLIQNAWKKLFGTDCPYRVKACGPVDGKAGADVLKNQLQYYHGMIEDELVIGLFDNDQEGNTHFKGLLTTLFEPWNQSSDVRKSLTTSIYGLLLPVPAFRSDYVNWTNDQRYLAIEHYFQNDILESKRMKGNTIANGSCFEIAGDKNTFSRDSINFEKTTFSHFEILFNRIKELINSDN